MFHLSFIYVFSISHSHRNQQIITIIKRFADEKKKKESESKSKMAKGKKHVNLNMWRRKMNVIQISCTYPINMFANIWVTVLGTGLHK